MLAPIVKLAFMDKFEAAIASGKLKPSLFLKTMDSATLFVISSLNTLSFFFVVVNKPGWISVRLRFSMQAMNLLDPMLDSLGLLV